MIPAPGPLKRFTAPLLGVLLLAFSFTAGVYADNIAPPVAAAVEVVISPLGGGSAAATPEELDLSALWKVWRALDEKFVPASTSTPALTDEEKVWGMIQGLAGAYGDPYTVFLPPAENEVFEGDVSGSFGGVGMEIGIRDGVLTVIAPLKDTPAARAGILAGDRIFKIDNELSEGMSVAKGVSKIRGPVGTAVVLTLVREGEAAPFDVSVVRDTITIPTLEAYLRKDNVFVIELYNFSALSPQKFRDALREFVGSGSRYLILDLRDNPGGYLEAAVDMASWFLPAGKVIVAEDFGGNAGDREHRSYGYDIFSNDLRMVVLVNRGSASASEILAGALSQHGVATLVGERTFGKGSVQELVPITGGTALKVTIAQWVTPNGTSISAGGLTPDIEVERTAEDYEAGADPQMERAVEYLLSH